MHEMSFNVIATHWQKSHLPFCGSAVRVLAVQGFTHMSLFNPWKRSARRCAPHFTDGETEMQRCRTSARGHTASKADESWDWN